MRIKVSMIIIVPILLIIVLVSVFYVMNKRAEINDLIVRKNDLKEEIRWLEDESRNLKLEIAALSQYDSVREKAFAAGMIEPSFSDGTWIYLQERNR